MDELPAWPPGTVAVLATGGPEPHAIPDPMAVSDRVAAVRLDLERILDHDQPRFEIEAGVAWRWTDAQAEADDAAIRAALARLS